jgi:Phosphatidylinositol-specific phospholipase C, Y domain
MDLMPSHYHSVNESQVSHIVSQYDNNPTLWRQYNDKHLTRCYPSNDRIVDGSNASPILPWAMGCQMVCQNSLTPDMGLLLNDGLFQMGGGCGYEEKPASLLMGGEMPPPKKSRSGSWPEVVCRNRVVAVARKWIPWFI